MANKVDKSNFDFSSISFYIAFDRYGNYGKEYVCFAFYVWEEWQADLVSDLEGGDIEMFEAVDKLTKHLDNRLCVCGVGMTPSESVELCEQKIYAIYKKRF